MGRKKNGGERKIYGSESKSEPEVRAQKHYFTILDDGELRHVKAIEKVPPSAWRVRIRKGEFAEVAAGNLFAAAEEAISRQAIRGVAEAIAKIMPSDAAAHDAPILLAPGDPLGQSPAVPPPAEATPLPVLATTEESPSRALRLAHALQSSRHVVVNVAPMRLPSAQRPDPPRLRIKTFFFPGSRPGAEFG